MLLAFAYCLFVVPLVLYSVVGIQDSQGDQPMADGTFLLKIIYLSRSVCRDGVQAWLCKTDSRLL